ncbi:hemopexin repeat-containing protein [Archangium lansingense]
MDLFQWRYNHNHRPRPGDPTDSQSAGLPCSPAA